MELFSVECTGYATRKNAVAKLAKVLNDYDDYRWFVVVLPNGRFLPVVKLADTDAGALTGAVAGQGVGVI